MGAHKNNVLKWKDRVYTIICINLGSLDVVTNRGRNIGFDYGDSGRDRKKREEDDDDDVDGVPMDQVDPERTKQVEKDYYRMRDLIWYQI